MTITLNYKKLLAMGLIGAGLSLLVTFAFAQTTDDMGSVVVDYLSQYYPQVGTLDTTTEAGQETLNHYFQELNDQSSLTLAAGLSLYAEQVGIPETTVTDFQETVWGESFVTALDHIEEVVQQTAEEQGTNLTDVQLLQEVIETVSQPYVSSVHDSAGVELLQEVIVAPELTAVLTSGIEGGFNSTEFVADEIQPAVDITNELVSGGTVQIGGVEVGLEGAVQAFNNGYVASYQQGDDMGGFMEEFFTQVIDNPGDVAKYVSNAEGSSAEAFGSVVKSFAQQLGGAGGASVVGNPAFAAMAQTAANMGATATAENMMAAFSRGYSGEATGGFSSLQNDMMKGFTGVQEFTAQAYDPAKASEFASQMQQAMGSQQGMGAFMGEHFGGMKINSEMMNELSQHATETGFNNFSPTEMATMMAAGAQQYQQMQQSGQSGQFGGFGDYSQVGGGPAGTGGQGGGFGSFFGYGSPTTGGQQTGETQGGYTPPGGMFSGFTGAMPSYGDAQKMAEQTGQPMGMSAEQYSQMQGGSMPQGGMTMDSYLQSGEGAGHMSGFGGFGGTDFAGFTGFDSSSFGGFGSYVPGAAPTSFSPGGDWTGGTMPGGTMGDYSGMMQGVTQGTMQGTGMYSGVQQGMTGGYVPGGTTGGSFGTMPGTGDMHGTTMHSGMTGPTDMSGPTGGSYFTPFGDMSSPTYSSGGTAPSFSSGSTYTPSGGDTSGGTYSGGGTMSMPPPGGTTGGSYGSYTPPPTGDGGGGGTPPPAYHPASLYGIYRTYYYPYGWGY